MNVQSYKKIFVCLTGSGKDHLYERLKIQGLHAYKHSSLNKDEAHELFSVRKIMLDTPKDVKRFTFVINNEKDVTNRIMKNYNLMILAENIIAVKNDQLLTNLYNTADYFIDFKTSDNHVVNSKGIDKIIEGVINDLVRKLR